MLKLTPISPEEAMELLIKQKVEEAIANLPTPSDGASGRDGRDGKDGVTTTVVKEVLANKEKLLDKEEFEKFRKHVVGMEEDLRNSLAATSNYFSGGRVKDKIRFTDSSITVSAFEYIICENTGPISITLPLRPVKGDIVNIKRNGEEVEILGQIDGQPCLLLNVPRYSAKLLYNGTEWSRV